MYFKSSLPGLIVSVHPGSLTQAKQRGITSEEVLRDIMLGKSRTKDMMSPIEVANMFIFGLSHYSKYLIGGDLLFDGGVVLTY